MFDVCELIAREVVPPASDRGGVGVPERGTQWVRRDVERGGDTLRLDKGGENQSLVANLDRPLRQYARRCDIPAPRPGAAAGLGNLSELFPALGLDPEAGMRAVWLPGIVCVRPIRAQPAALQQGGGDVSAVAQDVGGCPGRRGFS